MTVLIIIIIIIELLRRLTNVILYVFLQLPKLFVEKHDYRIYNKDIVFENNYWGKNQVFK